MTESKKQTPLISLRDMGDLSPSERTEEQLRLLDGLLARAVQAKKFNEALSITKRSWSGGTATERPANERRATARGRAGGGVGPRRLAEAVGQEPAQK